MNKMVSPSEKNVSLNFYLLTHVIYCLFALGILTLGFLGILIISSIIIIYIKRADVDNTIYIAHFEWLLQTFWWSLILGFIGIILIPIYVGYLFILVTLIWLVYRLIRGWLALFERITPI